MVKGFIVKEIELYGKVVITCVKNLATGNLELLVHFDDPNDMFQYFFVKDVEIGNMKFVPFKTGLYLD